jgi:hypothetical protein
MTIPAIISADDSSAASAVSWAAILAGAAVAAAAAIILFTLGVGLGFAALPGMSGHHRSATAFAVTSAIWLVVTQWLTAAIGGYVTGRLRTRWVNVHTHEVFFRDTAHGLITWALGALLGTILALGTVGSLAGAGMRGAGAMASSASEESLRYSIDELLRPSPTNESAASSADTSGGPGPAGMDAGGNGQAARILLHGIAQPEVPPADRDYLAHLVARRAGIPLSEARERVDNTITELRHDAEVARKAAATTGILTALSLLIGAFIACVSAALGGRLRDEQHLTHLTR